MKLHFVTALIAVLSSLAYAGPVPVDLTGVANVWAIATPGKPVTHLGLDGASNAYSASLLSKSVTWSGTTFNIGAADVADAVSNISIPLPAGNYTALQLLATGSGTNQPAQKFVVTYTDGTSSSVTQSLSDWFTPQKYPGEATVATMASRVNSTGSTGAGPFYLYGYTLPLDATKAVKALALPTNAHVAVLAAALLPAAASTSPVVDTVASAALNWTPPTENTDGSSLTDLASFNVYQGTSVNNMTKVGSITVGSTTYTTPSLPAGTYYFSVTAVNAAGMESSRSAVVSTILSPPPAKTPGSPLGLKITVTVTAGP